MTITAADLFALAGVMLLICFSAFFSGSETALTAASRARMHQLAVEGDKAARRVDRLIEDRESLIGAILLGNNLVNILATAIATAVFSRLLGSYGVAAATTIMTVLVLVFAEVLPKTYAITNTERAAKGVSVPVTIVVRVLSPIVAAVQAIVRAVLGVFGLRAEGDVLSARDEIRGAIELHHRSGGVAVEDRRMLGGILDLSELTVLDIMVHRKSIEMLDAGDPVEDVIDRALASRYTRLPLWRDHIENIVGVLHAKDLSRAIRDADGDLAKVDLTAVAREPWFVPETTPLAEQLNAFRAKREHFALAVDEYGALMGLVTLEDILEEIVGEIDDEFDKPVDGVQPQPDGSVLVDGAVAIRDLNRAMDWRLPDEEAVTVAGLVIHEAQSIPQPGQVFSFYGRRFEIVSRHRNQITQLKVAVIPEPPRDQP